MTGPWARSLAVLAAAAALAGPPVTRGRADPQAAAAHFAAAEAAERRRDFREAIAEYQAAYALRPHPDVQYNLGRAHEALGELLEAAACFGRYLEETDAPGDAAQVEARIGRLRERAARQLLTAALRAKGGRARMKALRQVTMRGTYRHVRPDGVVAEGTFARILEDGARQRVELRGPDLVEIQGTTPDIAWVHRNGALIVPQPQEAQSARNAIWRDRDFIVARALMPGARARAFDPQERAGVRYDVVHVARVDGSAGTTLYLDRATHLLAAVEFADIDGQRRAELGDYRTVGGIPIAHRIVNESTAGVFEVRVDRVELGARIPAGSFDPPR